MKCYLCNQSDFLEREGTVRDNKQVKVVECSNCGLVTLSSFDHIDESHYQDSKMHGTAPMPVEQWLQETENDDARRYKFFEQSLIGKKVLDFGCGNGGFLFKARNLAQSVNGVELELRLQSHFDQNNIKVWTSLEEIEKDSKFDLITAFHVFEHLSDPKIIMQQLSELLAEKGQLIIEIPSSSDALLTLYNSRAFADFTYWSQHLFLFNVDTVSQLVKQSGLKLNWVRQIQRYSLSNHLYWLSKQLPGGHKIWPFMSSPVLNEAYESQLAAIGKCDTLLLSVSKL